MGRRILVLLFSALAICIPQVAFALGLGEITLKSVLNQPLDAEIELLEVRDLSENEILVGLASPEDFERVGVDRPYFLTGLKFEVVLNNAGGPVIKVSSKKPVREPFLNFVLQAQWPSGRLLREYTLLMDLPVFSGEQSAPVSRAQTPSAPAATRGETASQSSPSQRAQPKSNYNPRSSFDEAPARPESQASASSQSYVGDSTPYPEDSFGPVQANDTLWEIAKQIRPDRGVTIQQTMLAIQRLNPDAFINNNINLLRKGQILRVPSREDITEYSKREAVSEVAVQNSQWSGDPNGGFSDGGAQIEASRSIDSYEEDQSGVEGRVKLSSPEEIDSSSEGRGAGAGSSSVDALENELAITLEQLDMSARENNDLRSKIQSLEEQISTMERMIEISSEDMRSLELAAEKSRTEQELAEAQADLDSNTDMTDAQDEDLELAVEGDATDSAVESPDSDDMSLADSSESTEELEEAAAIVEPTPLPQPTAKPVPNKVVQSQPKKTLVDTLLDNIVFIVVGLVLIIGVVVVALGFKKSDKSEDDDFLATSNFDDVTAPLEDPVEEQSYEELDLGEETPEEAIEEDITEIDDSVAAEAQTEDVVAEADIYIAYGKYDQAEEMLQNALGREPHNLDMRLKLLEVYSTQQEVEKFDPHYAKLLASGDEPAKQRGAQLRESIHDAPAFDPSLYDVSSETHLEGGLEGDLGELDSQLAADSAGDFDELSLDLDTDFSGEADADGLDFELDLPESETPQSELDDADSDLDFDLDLGDTEDDGAPAGDEDLDLDLELDTHSDELEAGTDAAGDLEFDLDTGDDALSADDFDLDFDLDADDSAASELDDKDQDALSLDSELDDFDLDFDADESSEDLTLDGIGDQDIEDELSLDDGFGAEVDDILSEREQQPDEDFSLEMEPQLEQESPQEEPVAEDKVEEAETVEDFLAGMQQEGDQPGSDSDSVDDYDLDADLDLSALDEELDALTSDLGVQEADIANLEAGDELEAATARLIDEDQGDQLARPTVMEEPVTDFDDFEQELELGDDLSLEPEQLGEDIETLLEPEPLQESAVLEEETLEDLATLDEEIAEGGEDQLFEQAIADVPESDLEFNIPDVDPESEDDDLGFLSDSDEIATKLDLARAYIDMGDSEGAKDIIEEIIKEGNDQQKQEAEQLSARII
ncbi:pilus assembly protein FimV [Alteromonadaceae bacterium Bs31]|nr:pilus assembly protein FimV [Alteromonadaceae bacterium Bs31]